MEIKLLEQGKPEQKEQLTHFFKIEAIYQKVKQEYEALKQELLNNFENCRILNGEEHKSLNITRYKRERKTLNTDKLLKHITQDTLNNCYDIKEVEINKVTVNEWKD